MLHIENNGKEIVATNFWETEHCTHGYFFASINAGALRLLIPPMREEMIKEVTKCGEVIVSIGPWSDAGGKIGVEILFEDKSPNPYCVHILGEQMDRLPAKIDAEKYFDCLLYTKDRGNVLRKPLKIRFVSSIPYLKPWGE